MRKLKLGILENEIADDHILWIKACEEMKDSVDWVVINITNANWLKEIVKEKFDGLLATPSGNSTAFRVLYDERINILNTSCGIPVFPSFEEILIYENKKYLAYWLEANNIPHPATNIFYYKKEALAFIQNTEHPLVAKTNIGASGSGVSILKSREDSRQYVEKAFSGNGIKRKVGPKWYRKGFIGRVFKKLLHPKELKAKLMNYKQAIDEAQRSFVLLQEYIPHTFEWRCVRIGDSFFAHKKLKLHDKASGSLLKGYENPPQGLLNFVKQVTDYKNFKSQAVDIFETKDGKYLVNEMQCIFGQSDPYQMLIDGQPGRYLYNNGQWIFEPGDFNRYESFLLRLETFVSMLASKRVN